MTATAERTGPQLFPSQSQSVVRGDLSMPAWASSADLLEDQEGRLVSIVWASPYVEVAGIRDLMLTQVDGYDGEGNWTVGLEPLQIWLGEQPYTREQMAILLASMPA